MSESSALHDEFGVIFNRLRCKDRDVWDRIHFLANDNHDPLAQAVLAIAYFQGFVEKDIEMSSASANQCFSWLHSQEDRDSHFCLGTFHYFGISVAIDKDKAVTCWRLAAEAGSELGQLGLGYFYDDKKNYVEAVKWYQLAADAGYCVAQRNVGICYREGNGVTKDLQQAIHWFRLSAEQGFCGAQYEIGCMYYDGEGLR